MLHRSLVFPLCLLTTSMSSETTSLTGPIVLGLFFSFVFFGFLCVQVFIYYVSFPRDFVYLKVYVALIFLIEIAITSLASWELWWIFGAGFGDEDRLRLLPFQPAGQMGQLPLAAFMMMMVHVFYSWRIWAITKQWFIPALTTAISFSGFVIAMYSAIYIALQARVEGGNLRKLETITTVDLCCSTSADVIITITLLFVLTRARKEAMHETAYTLAQIIKYTAETGLITLVAVLVTLIVHIVGLKSPNHSKVYVAFFYALPKTFSNTVLAALNSRILVKRRSKRYQKHAVSLLWGGMDDGAMDGSHRTSDASSRGRHGAEAPVIVVEPSSSHRASDFASTIRFSPEETPHSTTGWTGLEDGEYQMKSGSMTKSVGFESS